MRLFQIPSFCLSVQVLQAVMVRGDPRGITARRTGQAGSTGASTSVPVVIPKVKEEKRMRVAYVWLSSIKKIVAFVERICKVKET